MKADLSGQINLVANFLGKQLTEKEVEKLAEHLSFDSMRKNPAVNAEQEIKEMRNKGKVDENMHFMRSGIVGKYKSEMSPQMIENFDEWIERSVRGSSWKL